MAFSAERRDARKVHLARSVAFAALCIAIDILPVSSAVAWENVLRNPGFEQYRPFFGGWRSYGYVTYLSGWRKDAFTFGQYADYRYPDGTPLVLMVN